MKWTTHWRKYHGGIIQFVGLVPAGIYVPRLPGLRLFRGSLAARTAELGAGSSMECKCRVNAFWKGSKKHSVARD